MSSEINRGAAPSLRSILIGTVLLFVALIWILPYLVGTKAPSPMGSCPMDIPFEQLHVVVEKRGRDLVLVDCMYLGSRGTYSKGRR